MTNLTDIARRIITDHPDLDTYDLCTLFISELKQTDNRAARDMARATINAARARPQPKQRGGGGRGAGWKGKFGLTQLALDLLESGEYPNTLEGRKAARLALLERKEWVNDHTNMQRVIYAVTQAWKVKERE